MRRLAVIVATVATILLFTASAASAQCGQTTDVAPRRSLGLGRPPLAVGDSVLYDAAGLLSQYGFESDAMVCRTMAQGIALLQGRGGRLPILVVVALGTNGGVTTEQITELLRLVGPSRVLAMVTPHHGDYGYVPSLIRTAAREHPGRILLLDWDRLSAGHPDWLAPDGIHLGGAAGIEAFARLVADSLVLGPAREPAVTTPARAPTRARVPALPNRTRTKVRPDAPKPDASSQPRPSHSYRRVAQLFASLARPLRLALLDF
jgi:hypothetical protein